MTFLAEIRLNSQLAYRWARHLDLRHADSGYLAHSILAAAYGSHYPRPFAIVSEGRTIRLLGYTSVNAERLTRTRVTTADPEVASIVETEVSKPLPEDWESGDILGFRLRAAPVRRRNGAEFDAYQGMNDVMSREERYIDWLQGKIADAASIIHAELRQFSKVRVLRRIAEGEKDVRVRKTFELPSAIIEGTLKVEDPERFHQLLESGVGRHKAFGFGALLLRPPR